MLRAVIVSLCLLASQALADPSVLIIAQDRYEAGAKVRFAGPAVSDLLLAGNRVTVAGPVAGSAHLARRRVGVETAVAGDRFAAGYSVDATAAVGGDASVTGYELTQGPATGNLRAAGSEVRVADVGGYALITGQDVTLQGAITGDAVLEIEDIVSGPVAKVGGSLMIYANDPARINAPETVAPADRVKIQALERFDQKGRPGMMPMRPSLRQIATRVLAGVLISGLIAALVISVAPKAAQNWREPALAHPARAIWSGFLVTSALAGSGFVLMLTIIGVFLLPVMLTITGIAIFAGYSLGSYVLGVGIWLGVGRAMPDGLPGKFALACPGALVAGLAWLVPIAGRFFVLGLTILGIGTLAAFALPAGWLLRRDAVAV